MATAFTHSRRIEIARGLSGKKLTFGELRKATGIAQSALIRHLKKLESRRFVGFHRGMYRLAVPKNLFGKCLFGNCLSLVNFFRGWKKWEKRFQCLGKRF